MDYGDGDRPERRRANEVSSEEEDYGPLFPKGGLERLIGASSPYPVDRRPDLLVNFSLSVSAELGRIGMLVQDFLRLGPGATIELDKATGESVDVFANGRKFAEGDVVLVGEAFGIRITRLTDRNKVADG